MNYIDIQKLDFILFIRNDIDYRSDSWSTFNRLLHVFQGQQDDTGSALFWKKKITGGNSISLEYLKIFFRIKSNF